MPGLDGLDPLDPVHGELRRRHPAQVAGLRGGALRRRGGGVLGRGGGGGGVRHQRLPRLLALVPVVTVLGHLRGRRQEQGETLPGRRRGGEGIIGNNFVNFY